MTEYGYKGGTSHERNKGIMMNYDDAIRFIKDIGTIIDDTEIETEPDFPERFERAMRLFEYLVVKTEGMRTRAIKRRSGKGFVQDCGNCGFDLESSPHYKYCPNCGFKIWRLEEAE